MSDFSRDPDKVLADNLREGYVGLRIQQGVPILDRDLNLLQDLVAANVRAIVSRYLGSGVALRDGTGTTPTRSDAFQVAPVGAAADNDFVVKAGATPPGRCLVNGIELTIGTDVRYSAQGLPVLAPPNSGARDDTVYLDAFLVTEESGAVMENPDDVGVQTSVRLKPVWRVRVAVGGVVPPAEPGHGHLPLARVARRAGQPKITGDAITDLRPHCFALSDVRQLLLEPIVLVSPPAAKAEQEITIAGGRNFQFFENDVVTVIFPAAFVQLPEKNEREVRGAALTPTSLRLTVPRFTPPFTSQTTVPLTVRTAYGSTQTTIRILPN